MKINFAITSPEGALLNEEQAQEALAAGHSPADEDELELSGWLLIRHEGQPNLDFNDDLSMLMPNCPGVAASLRTTGRAELRMASYYCHLLFIAEGESIQVQQTDGTHAGEIVARYPKEGFLEALTACVERFRAYAAALAQLDARWTSLHADLVEPATQA